MTPNDADVQIIADLYHTELRTLLKSNRKNRKSRQPDPVKLMLEYSVSERVHVHEPGPGPSRTWIWSDLHLRHANIIKDCSRPFADADTMDRLLMEQWNQNVDPGDTLLNGGDVVHGGRVREADRVALRAAPGRKVLVIGNHDFHRRTGKLERAEHDVVSGIVTIDTDPPLALTHLPMEHVPYGWINIHGHVHNNEPLRDTPHINVCVEHTDYRPLLLSDVLTLAKRLITTGPPVGNTTVKRIQACLAEKTQKLSD